MLQRMVVLPLGAPLLSSMLVFVLLVGLIPFPCQEKKPFRMPSTSFPRLPCDLAIDLIRSSCLFSKGT